MDGLPQIPASLTLHDLRRTCCSLLFALGATLPEAMERIRHRDESTTLRIYAKVAKSRASDVDEAFDALIGNKPGNKMDELAERSGIEPEIPALEAA